MHWPATWPLWLRSNEPLARHTSMGVGGAADYFAEPSSLPELLELLQWSASRTLPLVFLGSGTNLLVSDRGFRGCVVRLRQTAFTRLQITASDETGTVRVACGAGVSTQQLVRSGVHHGFGPMRLLAGLPGSIGGAIAMNAQGIGQFIEHVVVATPMGHLQQRSQAECAFGYRYADLAGGLVVQATLRFQRMADGEDTLGVRQVLAHRRATQELQLPSAGCAFKNPSPTAPAGQLIDQSGVKRWHIGDACVSAKHANFIVNAGRARSTDVLLLMERIQQRVHRDHALWLEPEIRIIGERWEPATPAAVQA